MIGQGLNDGALLSARFGIPNYLAIDGAGNLYMSDQYVSNYHSIRKLSSKYSNVTTMAGKTCKFRSSNCNCAV
jgi:hypothetical protein